MIPFIVEERVNPYASPDIPSDRGRITLDWSNVVAVLAAILLGMVFGEMLEHYGYLDFSRVAR